MTISQELVVTPDSTFSTLQFEQEIINVLISSLLAVFILVNIGAIVSKLVQLTSHKHFSFKSYRRYMIFAHSDDPMRLLSWLRGRYAYREKGWERYDQKILPSRMLLPVAARLFIFIASIASIAITIPGEKILSGCENGDFRPTFDLSAASFDNRPRTLCIDVPLVSTLGTSTSTLAYCSFPTVFPNNDELGAGSGIVLAYGDVGQVLTFLLSDGVLSGFSFFLEWKEPSGQSFLTIPLNSIDPDLHMRVVVEALRALNLRCTAGNPIELDPQDGILRFTFVPLTGESCSFQPSSTSLAVERFMTNTLTMEKVEEPQSRLNVSNNLFTTTECPIVVTVNRPIVNLLPLFIVLVILFVINIAVTITVSNHGDILDSVYHLVKEALGHDCMSNPLEESTGLKSVQELPLQLSLRGQVGHAGFLQRPGDELVESFQPGTIVGNSAGVHSQPV